MNLRVRNLQIIKDFVGKQFVIYNGHLFESVNIVEKMVNHKVGEFVLTKKLGSTVHSENQIQVKKRKKKK